MRFVCHFFALWLLALPAVAQDDAESSELERSLSFHKLQQLVESRDRANAELQNAATDTLSHELFTAFRDPHDSVAIATMDQVTNVYGGQYTLQLKMEKVLRGNLPQNLTVQCSWSATSWVFRPPLGAQRFKPEDGRRVLIAVHETSSSNGRPDKLLHFQGVLNLDDRAEAALLPYALAAAEMDATATMSAYEKNLSSENAAVRDLALHRLMAAKGCPADASCEDTILNEVRSLLAGKNPNDRMEAVQWLGKLADGIGDCQMMKACRMPQFRAAPVRELLQAAVEDQNVAVGDEAFLLLATLDFHKKENAGYCEEIVPAMRAVERYLYTDGKHVIGGSLSGSSVCLAATR